MSCSLKPAGIRIYTAAKGSVVTIKLNAPQGGASMVSAVATPATGAQVVYPVAGDAFTFPVLLGITTLVMMFPLSGAHVSATLVEDCGGPPSIDQPLAIIEAWHSSDSQQTLTIIGT